MTTDKIIIIGVGNPLRRDDGIGPLVIQELLALQPQEPKLQNVTLLDGGTDGLALLDVLPNYTKAIIIDAVAMARTPGSVVVFTPDEAIINVQFDALSTHGFGLAEMLKLAEQLQIATEITIIGVQPSNVDFGEGLSAAVAAALPQIIVAVRKFL